MAVVIGAREGGADRAVGPFEPMLSGLDLPPVFVKMFLLPANARYDVVFEGAMDQIWSVRWVRPLLWILARWNTLFPEQARGVPTQLHISNARDRRGRPCHRWNRTFRFPHEKRRFDALLSWDEERSRVIELTGPRECFEAAWEVRFRPRSIVEVRGSVVSIRFGKIRIPIPRLLQLDATAIDTATPGREDELHCDLVMSSPAFGRLFGYRGTFRARRIPHGPPGSHVD